MKLADFDYALPPELIAQEPVEPRDASRLLVVRRASAALEHRRFAELADYLEGGDLLVVNDSRVINARLRGAWEDTRGAVEALLLHPEGDGTWQALLRSGRRILAGRFIRWRDGSRSEILSPPRDGVATISLPPDLDLATVGELPLPPYIRRQPADPARYQTVYAAEDGSVAAPTAGLHFTPALLESLAAMGVAVAKVTLHVGAGTFRPVQTDEIAGHLMHAELGRLTAGPANQIRSARDRGRRVVAVGTTSVRLVEQWAVDGEDTEGWIGWTRLLILPGFEFRAVSALVTNFHLPRTTLLMLVSAFAGDELRRHAYDEAIRQRYRFYSFGDAMLIL